MLSQYPIPHVCPACLVKWEPYSTGVPCALCLMTFVHLLDHLIKKLKEDLPPLISELEQISKDLRIHQVEIAIRFTSTPFDYQLSPLSRFPLFFLFSSSSPEP